MSNETNEVTKQSVTDRNHLGDAAKMREALRQVSRVAVEMTRKTVTGESEDRKTVDEWALRLCDIVSSTLADPPRNCDVGTAEEQAERFRRFCGTHKPDESQFTEEGELLCPSTGCELIACNYGQCALAWSHMPYEEGGEK